MAKTWKNTPTQELIDKLEKPYRPKDDLKGKLKEIKNKYKKDYAIPVPPTSRRDIY